MSIVDCGQLQLDYSHLANFGWWWLTMIDNGWVANYGWLGWLWLIRVEFSWLLLIIINSNWPWLIMSDFDWLQMAMVDF